MNLSIAESWGRPSESSFLSTEHFYSQKRPPTVDSLHHSLQRNVWHRSGDSFLLHHYFLLQSVILLFMSPLLDDFLRHHPLLFSLLISRSEVAFIIFARVSQNEWIKWKKKGREVSPAVSSILFFETHLFPSVIGLIEWTPHNSSQLECKNCNHHMKRRKRVEMKRSKRAESEEKDSDKNHLMIKDHVIIQEERAQNLSGGTREENSSQHFCPIIIHQILIFSPHLIFFSEGKRASGAVLMVALVVKLKKCVSIFMIVIT